MEITGIWKLKELETIKLENDKPQTVMVSREELLQGDDDDMKQMAGAVYEFSADGTFNTKVGLPEGVTMDDLDEEEKAMLGPDGLFTISSQSWKEEGGKFYLDSGEHREIFGEVQSPWDEIAQNPDGSITINGTLKYVLEK